MREKGKRMANKNDRIVPVFNGKKIHKFLSLFDAFRWRVKAILGPEDMKDAIFKKTNDEKRRMER
jgi:hypothetical protein